jgi:hypothetical protein
MQHVRLRWPKKRTSEELVHEERVFSVSDRPDSHIANPADGPNPKLVELSKLLVGTWRVDGPDIRGQAEYESKNEGRLLVAYVDFSVSGSRMRVIQHIMHHEDHDALIARYMDTMGNEATYTWTLEDQTLRVSLGSTESNTYFEATLNEDNSQYIGTWHYPDGDPPDATETIVYTRVDRNG